MFASVLLLVFLQTPGEAPAPLPAAHAYSPADIGQFRAKAESGDTQARLKLGMAYEDGNGVQQDYGEAAKWYRKAADQGSAAAQNDLGFLYATGHGVEKSKEEAVRWYAKAARQKYATAMFNLGAAYYSGDGAPSNYETAYAWFLLAQECGSEVALDPAKRMFSDLKDLKSREYTLTSRSCMTRESNCRRMIPK